MLHMVDYIKCHGCAMNYDGSRGEKFGRLKIKDNAQLTNKQKETLNFNISRRISKEDIADDVCTLCNIKTWVVGHHHSVMNQRIISQSGFSIKNATYPRFKLKVTIEPSDNDDDTEVVSVHVDWGTK